MPRATLRLLIGIVGTPPANWPVAEDGANYVAFGVEHDGTLDGLTQAFSITEPAAFLLNWYDSAPNLCCTPSRYSVLIVTNTTFEPVVSVTNDAGTLAWQAHALAALLRAGSYSVLILGEPPTQHVASAIDNVSLVRTHPRTLGHREPNQHYCELASLATRLHSRGHIKPLPADTMANTHKPSDLTRWGVFHKGALRRACSVF